MARILILGRFATVVARALWVTLGVPIVDIVAGIRRSLGSVTARIVGIDQMVFVRLEIVGIFVVRVLRRTNEDPKAGGERTPIRNAQPL